MKTEKERQTSMSNEARRELSALYEHPLASSRTGPLYNAFSYPTKIAPEAIALFIATHTRPGQVVMDTFAGSGTAGIATLLCDKPTPEMIRLAKARGLSPQWGPRSAVLYELSVIGSFVAGVMCSPPDPLLFEREANALIAEAYAVLGAFFEVVDDTGRAGVLRHSIWSELLICKHCSAEHSFWHAAVQQAPLRLRPSHEPYPCPHCRASLVLHEAPRAIEHVFDPVIGQTVEQRKRVPVRVYGTTGTRKWQRPAQESDLDTLLTVDAHPLPPSIPRVELKLGDLYRSGYHFGLTHLHHLYTRRNLVTIATLLDLVEKRHPDVQDALKVLVLSYNQSHGTLMTRVVVKDGTSDFVLTGAQSGVLYVSSLPVEKNVIEGVKRKIKPLRDSFQLVRGSRSTVTVRNQSSTSLLEKPGSVDYVFTDPPFSDFIPYAEINQVNELWLGRRTDDTNEAVVSPAQGKALVDYERLMSQVFAEVDRVLKPNGVATVVFHAAKATVWTALQNAYRAAGLDVMAASVLDKLQTSFKQVVSNVSVKGDPLLLLAKHGASAGEDSLASGTSLDAFIAHSKSNPNVMEHEQSRMYSRYVNRRLSTGNTVELDAAEFYAKVQEAVLHEDQ